MALDVCNSISIGDVLGTITSPTVINRRVKNRPKIQRMLRNRHDWKSNTEDKFQSEIKVHYAQLHSPKIDSKSMKT
jgi:hypothetical protein